MGRCLWVAEAEQLGCRIFAEPLQPDHITTRQRNVSCPTTREMANVISPASNCSVVWPHGGRVACDTVDISLEHSQSDPECPKCRRASGWKPPSLFSSNSEYGLEERLIAK